MIALTLNDQAVPTKRGGRWFASTIKYLLENHQLYGKAA